MCRGSCSYCLSLTVINKATLVSSLSPNAERNVTVTAVAEALNVEGQSYISVEHLTVRKNLWHVVLHFRDHLPIVGGNSSTTYQS